MTTGNDTARLDAIVDKADQIAGQPAPQDDQPQPTPAIVDPDDLELTEAKTALEAEKGTDKADGQTGAPVEAGAPPPPAAGKAPAAADGLPHVESPPMIPKPRFDEVLTRASKAEHDAAYWRGVAEARAQPAAPAGAPGTAQPAQQPTAEQRLADIRNQTLALAEKFDAGEITMKDFKAQESELADTERQIREDLTSAKANPAQAGQGSDALFLETKTAELEQAHPWVKVFDAVGTNTDWDYLKSVAIQNLVSRGVDPTRGDLGRYNLRKEMAELADTLGPALVGNKAKAQGIALPGQTQQPVQQQPGSPPLSPAAKARQAALEKQAGAPPDLAALSGSTGDDPGTVSDSRIETMTDEEISALPQSVRRRVLGIT